MKYEKTIGYLYDLQKSGMKFGLDNITRLMTAAGNPERSFRSVHVAGTNGKGSTCSMIEAILRTSGAKTGLFTSPHLVSFTERIRVNGVEISEDEVIDLADEVRRIAGGMKDFSPTFFEVVTAMAFLHFKRMKADWVVAEVGLGGRLDATNVIVPEVSVITRIGIDHCDFLGNTLEEIAREKAGIIKERIPVVTAAQAHGAMDIIERATRERHSPLFRYGSEFHSESTSEDADNPCFRYRGNEEYPDIRLPLSGEHQLMNASLAAKAAEIISGRYPSLRCDITKGLEGVRWPGRLEMVKDYPPVLIDGAHNPQAAEVLAAYLRKLLDRKYRRILLVLGIMGDKDVDGIMRPLLPLASEILFTAPAYGRAASPDVLSSRASAMGYSSRIEGSVPAAVEAAERLALPDDLIVITGSFYTIGEAKEFLVDKGVLSRLRE